MRRKAAFLERDGVINVDRAHVHRAEDFDLLPGVMSAMELLRGDGYVLVVVTNQSGIARGFYTEEDYRRVTDYMRSLFARHGIRLDGVYHCPHHPEGQIERYRRVCDCRKPGAALVRKAMSELHIDPAASMMVGNSLADVQAGRAAGVGHCYLIAHGKDVRQREADGVFPSLLECARSVCAQVR